MKRHSMKKWRGSSDRNMSGVEVDHSAFNITFLKSFQIGVGQITIFSQLNMARDDECWCPKFW